MFARRDNPDYRKDTSILSPLLLSKSHGFLAQRNALGLATGPSQMSILPLPGPSPEQDTPGFQMTLSAPSVICIFQLLSLGTPKHRIASENPVYQG